MNAIKNVVVLHSLLSCGVAFASQAVIDRVLPAAMKNDVNSATLKDATENLVNK